VSFLDTGYADMMKQLFPPIPTPGFSPNFTGYDLDNINWYEAYEAMSQSRDDALVKASDYWAFIELFMNHWLTVDHRHIQAISGR